MSENEVDIEQDFGLDELSLNQLKLTDEKLKNFNLSLYENLLRLEFRQNLLEMNDDIDYIDNDKVQELDLYDNKLESVRGLKNLKNLKILAN